MNKYTANQDIRDYMADHGVGQKALAAQLGIAPSSVCIMLKKELSQQEKENLLNQIDACVKHPCQKETELVEDTETEDVSASTKFQIGDRVKIPSKEDKVGTVSDIWHSLSQDKLMYAVDVEGGIRGLYAEAQLEPAPLPIEYSWEAHIDGNVAVVTMNATQGEKTWVYARGHAHIIHNGEVGMAQAISYAARRMFESLDGDSKIYVKK